MPQVTVHQARVLKALRKGIDGVIGSVSREEERRASYLVTNKAEDIECVLDLLDELLDGTSPAADAGEAS